MKIRKVWDSNSSTAHSREIVTLEWWEWLIVIICVVVLLACGALLSSSFSFSASANRAWPARSGARDRGLECVWRTRERHRPISMN